MRPFGVTRRRHTAPVVLPALTGCALVLALLSACAAQQHPQSGVARGQLLLVGGPFPGLPRPLASGSVSFSGATRVSVRVSSDGSFSASLPNGSYEVSGRSAEFGSGSYPCRASRPISVVSDKTTLIDVYCQAR